MGFGVLGPPSPVHPACRNNGRVLLMVVCHWGHMTLGTPWSLGDRPVCDAVGVSLLCDQVAGSLRRV